VLPLAIAEGPGSELRQVLGTAVFVGMLGVTFFGLFLTPAFYVILRRISGKQLVHRREQVTTTATQHSQVSGSTPGAT
jgi:hypothetical protein